METSEHQSILERVARLIRRNDAPLTGTLRRQSRSVVLVGFGLLAACSGVDAPTATGIAGSPASAGMFGSSGAPEPAGVGAGSANAGGGDSAGDAGGMPAAAGAVSVAGASGSLGSAETGGSGAASAGASAASAGASAAGDTGSAGASGTSGYDPCPSKGTPCTIMPLGDSITYGYGSTNDDGTKNGGGYRVEIFTQALAAGVSINFVGRNMSGPKMVAGRAFPRANEGYSGYTIDQVSAKVPGALSAVQPNIILMMVGTNDMNKTLDVATAPTRLGKIIDQIVAAAPNALLLVGAPIPANGNQDALTQAFDAKVPGVVQQRASAGKHVMFVDLYTPMAPWSRDRFNDSEHPNDAGYKIMADTWWSKIGGLFH